MSGAVDRVGEAPVARGQPPRGPVAPAAGAPRSAEEPARSRRLPEFAAEDLRASEERFRTLVGSMDDYVFTMDVEQRFVAAYGARWAREGLSTESLAGKAAAEVFDAPAAAVHEAACARALAGEHVVYEWSYLRAQGGERHFQSSLSPLRGPDGAVLGLVGVARDVTQGKQAEARLAAGERLSSLGTLAAGVAHEINNPLTYVVANLEYLQAELRDRVPGGARLLPAIADALTGADRVKGIIGDMKDLSRSEPARKGPADLGKALEVAVRMAQHEIRHRGRLLLDQREVPPVVGDQGRLVQVFLNLLVNAAQALPPGGAERNEIRVVVRQAGDTVVVEVHDNGAGIPADVLPKVFDPFFTTKPLGEGTGLGLSICQAIVTRFGGGISARSEPGRGTTVTVVLPVAAPPGEAARPAPGPQATARRRLEILVVDDDPVVCAALSRILAEAHGVQAVTSAAEVLRLLDGGSAFDVLVCDVMMPEMSGTRLHGELVRRAPALADRTLFLSGGVFVEESRAYLEALPNPRLEKPCLAAELFAAVDRLGGAAPGRPAHPGAPAAPPPARTTVA